MFVIWFKWVFQKFGDLGFLRGTILLTNPFLGLLAIAVWFLLQMNIDKMCSFIVTQHYQGKLDFLVL